MPAFKIITEAQPHLQKTMLVGLPGVGKSTLASQMNAPLFIDMEGGLTNMDVARTPTISMYASALTILKEIHANAAKYKADYQTLVIDSIDWLCRRAEEHAAGVRTVVDNKLVADYTATIGKANGGYGNGMKQLENHIRSELMPILDALVADGFAICLVAHADQKDVMDADGVAITKITPAIHEKLMHPFVQWCDNVFYLRNDHGVRKLLLDSTDTILAKNRLGKMGEVNLDETTIQDVLTPSATHQTNNKEDK